MKKNFARFGRRFSKKDIYKCPKTKRVVRDLKNFEKSGFTRRWSKKLKFLKIFVTIKFCDFYKFIRKGLGIYYL